METGSQLKPRPLVAVHLIDTHETTDIEELKRKNIDIIEEDEMMREEGTIDAAIARVIHRLVLNNNVHIHTQYINTCI